MNKYRNKDGTYNGAAALADFSGLTQEEILWTFTRSKELYSEGLTKEQVLRIIKEEGKTKPWEK